MYCLQYFYSCKKGRVILRQGHVGQHFYMLFSGSVLIQRELGCVKVKGQGGLECVLEKGSCFGVFILNSNS